MWFLYLSLALVSIAKGAGSFALLTLAEQLYHISLDYGGWYLLLHPLALYLVLLSCVCLYDSASEFIDILAELFGDEDNDHEN